MLIKNKCNTDNPDLFDIQYYGKDAEKFLKEIDFADDIKFLGKECLTRYGTEGIIIGVEDSNTYMNYYYIVYIPTEERIIFELVEDIKFIDSIEL